MSTLTKKVGARQHVILDRVQYNISNAPALGFLTIDLGNAFSGNYTLSGSEYNNYVLRFTGILIGDGYIIVPDDAGAFWTFKNDTTGAFKLRAKTSGQSAASSVEITQSGAIDVYEGYVAPNYIAFTTTPAGTGSGGAPADASYLTLGTNGTLTNERVLTFTGNFSTTDGGANNPYTVNLSTTAVTPGTYINSTITVDGYGRITSAVDGYSGILTFNTISDLRAYNTTGLAEGVTAFVNTLNATYEFANNATDTLAHDPLNFTILTSTNGGSPPSSRWFRKISHDIRWAKKATWYVNGTSGDNENSGDLASPIKTAAELYKRIGDQILSQNIIVHYLADGYSNDRVMINPNWTSDGYSIVFKGNPTASTVHTLSNTILVDRSTNTPAAATKATLWSAAGNSTILKSNNGVTDGYCVGLSETVDGYSLQITNPYSYDDLTGLGTQDTYLGIAGGDTLTELVLPTIELSTINASNVYLELLAIQSPGVIVEKGGSVVINRCRFSQFILFDFSTTFGVTVNSGGRAYVDNCVSGGIVMRDGGHAEAHNTYLTGPIYLDGNGAFYQNNQGSDAQGDLFFNMAATNQIADDSLYNNKTNSIAEFANVCLINVSGLGPNSPVMKLLTGSSIYFRNSSAIYADINTNIDGYIASVYGVGSMLVLGDTAMNIYAKFDGSGLNILGEFIHNNIVRWGSTDFPITNLVKFNGVISGSSS